MKGLYDLSGKALHVGQVRFIGTAGGQDVRKGVIGDEGPGSDEVKILCFQNGAEFGQALSKERLP